MLLSLCLLRYIMSCSSPFCIDTDDEVPSNDESESDTHIKVPPPPPPTDRGTKESDFNYTSSSDANKGTLHLLYSVA